MAPGFGAWLLLVCLLYFAIVIKCIPPAAQCIHSEREALIKFKSKLHDPSHRLASWDDGPNCCQWEGITCDNNTGNVIELDIHSPCIKYDVDSDCGHLSGEIDPVLAQLKHLRYIDLSLNTFDGLPIPSFFGFMEELHYLNLSRAGFSGSVPKQLGNLSNLQVLDISSFFYNSSLSSTDLNWLKTMQSLKHLGMNSVDLSAVSADWIQIFNELPNLESFYAQACDIQKIDSNPLLANFTSLRVLDLSYNNLPGASLLQWLTNLTALEFLDLSGSIGEYQGKFSYTLSELPNLEELIMTHCHLNKNVSELFAGSWKKIRRVDLSSNDIYGELPNSLGNITSLKELVMEENNLTGYLPEKSIRNLKYVALSDNRIKGIQVGNSTSLEHLYLSSNGVIFLKGECFRNLVHLKYLDLSSNELINSIPKEIRLLTRLEHLDLSDNIIIGGIPPEIGNLTSLKTMDCSHNKIYGVIPKELGRMVSLNRLNLSNNKLYGSVPKEIGNLVKLYYINLSDNELTRVLQRDIGKLINLQFISFSRNEIYEVELEWLCPLKKLYMLDLTDCRLTSPLPQCLGSMSSLISLFLSGNKLNGTLPSTIGKLSNLEALELSSNNLHGFISEAHFQNMSNLRWLYLQSIFFKFQLPQNWIPPFQLRYLILISCHVGPAFPSWLRTQNNLDRLVMSNTSIDDRIPLWFWNIAKYYTHLDLGDNKIRSHLPNPFPSLIPGATINLSNNLISGNIPSFSSTLRWLDLSGNRLSGTIPFNLGQMSKLKVLDLSGNRLSGTIPFNLGRIRELALLDLSRNRLNGTIPFNLGQMSKLEVLDLSGNRLSGTIPFNLGRNRELWLLDLSGNRLSGTIPFNLGQMSKLDVLVLRGNRLSGTIPSNLGRIRELAMLDLSRNRLNGTIPFNLGQMSKLKVLDLSGNQLSGKLPFSLGNCSSIGILDIGENKLEGDIPRWIGTSFPALRVLRLRNNSFTGQIPSTLSTLESLAVLDLAGNSLSGQIPKTLGGLRSMKQVNKASTNMFNYSTYYQIRVIVSMKGQMLEYSSTLSLVTSLDFSFNNLSGPIPPELADLSGLLTLDLSHNRLSGSILNNIGHLNQLQSLDLSWNELSGEIPPSISNLTFLCHLNLSYNQLSGRIPTGQQLQTLDDPSIYVGNSQLCGNLLPLKCPGDNPPNGQSINKISKEEDNSWMWIYVSIGTGFVSGFWVFYVVLIFKNAWRSAYFRLFDVILMKVDCKMAVMKARIYRKFQRD